MAVAWARRLAALSPSDEAGWQCLMLMLDRSGDRASALTVYEALATRLREELEVAPSPETQALASRIRERAKSFEATPNRAGAPSADLAGVERIALPSSAVIIGLLAVENRTGDPQEDLLASRLTDKLAKGLAGLDYVVLAWGRNPPNAAAVVPASLPAGSRSERR
jgi:hypothetical protein